MDQLSGINTFTAKFVAGAWLLAAILAIVGVRGVHRTWTLTRSSTTSAARRRLVRAVDCSAWSSLVIIGLVIACAVSVNAYFAYLPTLGDAADTANGDRQWVDASELTSLPPNVLAAARSHGLVTKLNLAADPENGFARTVNVVYLPPQYFTQPAATFPTVYLFHGSPGRPGDWFHAGRAEQTAFSASRGGRPVIVVAPQMSRSWTDDPHCVDSPRQRGESHFLNEVLPAVDGQLRTRPQRDGRILAGMSAGGYCALHLGLAHRELASTIIDMSGDPGPLPAPASLPVPQTQLEAGSIESTEAVATSPPNVIAEPTMRVWLDSGSADHDTVGQMTALDHALGQRACEVVWRVRPGGHTYWVWTNALRESLPWALGGSPVTTRPASKAGPTN